MSNNYFHVTEKDTEINACLDTTIMTGCDTNITIEKAFGPLVADSIRIHLDYDSVCWIIERERIEYKINSIKKNSKGVTFIDNDVISEWDEVARINANTPSKDIDELAEEYIRNGGIIQNDNKSS